MKIPDSIRIGGVEYAVQHVDNLRDGTVLEYGHIDYDNSVIALSSTDGAECQRKCITLLHEILHGVINHMGMEVENEEEVVTTLAKGLYQVLQDNSERLFGAVE